VPRRKSAQPRRVLYAAGSLMLHLPAPPQNRNRALAPGLRSKMGVDATTKWPSEGFTRPWPDEIKMDPEVKKKIDALWPSLGLK